MRVKLTRNVISGGDIDSSTALFLQADPAVLADNATPDPYRLLSALGHEIRPIPPVIIAAVRPKILKADEQMQHAKSISHAVGSLQTSMKRKSPMIPDETAQRLHPKQKKSKPSHPSVIVLPFKLISPVGLAPVPPTITLQSEEVNASPSKAAKMMRPPPSKNKMAKGVVIADAHVSVSVIPAGQSTDVGNNHKATKINTTKPKDNKSKVARPLKPSDTVTQAPTRAAASLTSAGMAYIDWHPGMRSCYGVTYIDPVTPIAVIPPPPLVQGVPPRQVEQLLTQDDVPTIDGDDPIATAIEYLRYLATAVGRLPSYPPRVQQVWNEQQLLYRERLGRVLHARDGRRVGGSRPEGTRRSNRTRIAPGAFMSSKEVPMVSNCQGPRGFVSHGLQGDILFEERKTPASGIQPFNPADLTDVRLGMEFQAMPPPLRPKPVVPPPDEVRWISHQTLEAGSAPAPKREPKQALSLRSMPQGIRTVILGNEVARLTSLLGPSTATAFGLGSMGSVMAGRLTTEQQDALGTGMEAVGRDFHIMARDYVPGIAPRVLAAYYYDVWKLRAVPAAVRWYEARAAEEAAALEEEAKAEKQRAEEAARKAERNESSNRRRQMKDALQWVRGAARLPAKLVNYNKPIVRERADRLIRVLRGRIVKPVAAGA